MTTTRSVVVRSVATRRYSDARWYVAVLLVAVALWVPRLRGPLDLRYDAGVYHLLGTSLAQGKGYRILSEPGAIEAIQYPPLLPALDAAVQWMIGTSDPAATGYALRLVFFVLFIGYTGAVFALARRYLSAPFAFMAALVTLLHVHTTFMSDLLFADFPFAVAGVAFLLVATRRGDHDDTAGAKSPGREEDLGSWRTTIAAALTAVAFGLRTAGVALSAAWVAEAALRRRWRTVVIRSVIAAVPVLAWQQYVREVKASAEFQHPSYPYQRADYQFYNVGYLENMTYVDPFQPELGRVGVGDVVVRIANNLGYMPVSLGEAVNSDHGWWKGHFEQVNQKVGTTVVPEWFVYVIDAFLTAVVIGGFVVLWRRGHRLLVLVAAASVGLVVSTPWPGQFARYLAPITPLLAIALWTAVAAIVAAASRAERPMIRRLGPAVLLLVGVTVLQQAYTLLKVYRKHHRPATYIDASGTRHSYRLFFYDRPWQLHERALDWLAEHGRPGEVIATSTPHWAYLRTGLTAVMPPFELDGSTAKRLLDAVPVTYLVADSLAFVNVGHRYTRPVLDAYPERWRLVYRVEDGSRVYRAVAPVTASK